MARRVVSRNGRLRLVASVLTFAVWGLWLSPAGAQQFVPGVYRDAQGEHKYQVFVPAGYNPERPAPAILFLHGAGEIGADGQLPTLVGLGPYVKARGASFPFLAIFPQVEETEGRFLSRWAADSAASKRALEILKQVQSQYRVDERRIALVGWSMGGYGAWSLGAAHPEMWSAVVPISGGGDPEFVARLKDVPVWAFHGGHDTVVLPEESRKMVAALREAGGNVTYTEFPEGGHTIFQETFGNDGFIAWLQDPKKQPARLSPTSRPLQIEAAPFIPALEIPGAVGIRIGNSTLEALSYNVPQMVPPSLLSGRLNDMFDSSSVRGRDFSVRFYGISYYGQLERVQIQATGQDRLNVQLGLRNIRLVIGGTSITGARHSAQAGPIQISIGHTRPVWLSLDVKPFVSNRRLRLQLLGVGFSIPADTYAVSQPAGVSTRGFGMTRERVVDGLMSGLYGARGRVENEVRAIAPSIVAQLEQQLIIADPGPMISSVWPLPVYQPRLQSFPEQVSVDAEGISLVMGLTAAKVNPVGPTGPLKTVAPAGVSLAGLQGGSLGFAVAPQILHPLSDLVVQEGLARVNVLDLPEKSFGRLADRQTLEEVLPDLKHFGPDLQINSELILTAPMDVAKDADAGFGVKFPAATLAISIKPNTEAAEWQPYAMFDLRVTDRIVPELEKPTHEYRALRLGWSEKGTVEGSGRFADGPQPEDKTIHADRVVELFQESWNAWTTHGAVSDVRVPDFHFGATTLRMQALDSQGPVLAGKFDVPTIKLSNASEEAFHYETKGPFSNWSAPLVLEPGQSHEFPIPYPLTYRERRGNSLDVFTLATGSHSEYRVPLAGGQPRLFTARPPAQVAP